MDFQELPLLRTDSYAKIFLYNTHETVACVPRHTIRMSEPVKPDILQRAVAQTLLRFPHMLLGIEPTATGFRYVQNVREPVVLPFDGAETRYAIGTADTNGFLFLVGYRDDTITMEYQHSISDGRGFEEFVRSVLFCYLQLCGKPVENDGSVRGMDTRYSPDESADGYRQLAEQEFSSAGIWKKPEALHADALTGLGDGPEIISEVTFPFSALHAYAKAEGVSPLSVIAPLFMRAFDEKFGAGQDKPVIAQIPVDLRPLLPTATTRYFICFIDLPYLPEYRAMPFAAVCRETKAFLKSQMAPEQLMYRAKAASDRCRELHEADMPRAEKCAAGQELCKNFVLEDSFLITNVGEFRLPASCTPYVLDYGAVLPTAVQPFALLISSYNGKMKLSVAQRDHDLAVVASLTKGLQQIGVQADSRSYPFAVTRYDGNLCG